MGSRGVSQLRLRVMKGFRVFRVSADGYFVISLPSIMLVSFLVIVWFNPTVADSPYYRLLIVSAVVSFPILLFVVWGETYEKEKADLEYGKTPSLRARLKSLGTWGYIVVATASVLGVVVQLSDHYEWPPYSIGMSILWWMTFVMFILPIYFIVRRPVLGIALLPAVVLIVTIALILILPDEDAIASGSLVLYALAFLIAVWSAVATAVLRWAENHRQQYRMGPLTELAAMLALFAPFMYAIYELGQFLPDAETWWPVLVTVGGVLVSAVISDPLRTLVRACWDPRRTGL